jgi:hypothetical protein
LTLDYQIEKEYISISEGQRKNYIAIHLAKSGDKKYYNGRYYWISKSKTLILLNTNNMKI